MSYVASQKWWHTGVVDVLKLCYKINFLRDSYSAVNLVKSYQNCFKRVRTALLRENKQRESLPCTRDTNSGMFCLGVKT